MINRGAGVASKGRSLPNALPFTDLRLYLFTSLFVMCNVGAPWLVHRLLGASAGRTLLPMHFFALLAGLFFGWRAGLLVGAATPLISYLMSGMPVLPVLPQTAVEIAVYGLAAGILFERLRPKINTVWALAGAMVAGRLALLIAVVIMNLYAASQGLPQANPFAFVYAAVRQGLPGIAVQLVSIPLIIFLAEKLMRAKERGVE